MSQKTNRRDFMKTTAAASAVGYFAAAGAEAQESKSALEKINFASVGVGGKGSSDSSDAGRNGNMVAICDVDDKTIAKAAGKFKDAKQYYDYRTMLDEMGDKIDAITVSTPDHMHAMVASAAMAKGIHCFCQKPLTHSISEARHLGDLARAKNLVTQMGNQGTAGSGLRDGAAQMKAGALGTIKECHVWTNRPVWPQGGDRPEEKPVPEHLHWPEWLGGAEPRPYGDGYHTFKWRGWWAFGTGALGDMACHTFNMAFMGLDLRNPISVEAESSGHNRESYPKWTKIHFVFPATDNRPAIDVYWYSGGKRVDPALVPDGVKIARSGTLVIGDKGKLYSGNDYGANYSLHEGAEKKKVEYTKSPGHFTEFVNGIKGGPEPVSNFPNYAGPLSETILLGNLAVWAGKKVEWDAKNMKVTNFDDPSVNEIVRHKYHSGYKLGG